MKQNYFLEMIRHLRQHEEIMLFGNILSIEDGDAAEVVSYLQEEYNREALEYPHTAPLFDAAAALWAAKTINTAAQLLLYRQNKPGDLTALLPPFDREINPASILSADLCLRFLPDTLRELKLIDSMDPLISLLHAILEQWHYSGIHYPLETAQPDFGSVVGDPCLRQLYVNRIIQFKNLKLANHPLFRDQISGDLGLFAAAYWKEFQTEKQIHGNH